MMVMPWLEQIKFGIMFLKSIKSSLSCWEYTGPHLLPYSWNWNLLTYIVWFKKWKEESPSEPNIRLLGDYTFVFIHVSSGPSSVSEIARAQKIAVKIWINEWMLKDKYRVFFNPSSSMPYHRSQTLLVLLLLLLILPHQPFTYDLPNSTVIVCQKWFPCILPSRKLETGKISF